MVISNDIEIKCDVRTRNLKWTMKTIKQHLRRKRFCHFLAQFVIWNLLENIKWFDIWNENIKILSKQWKMINLNLSEMNLEIWAWLSRSTKCSFNFYKTWNQNLNFLYEYFKLHRFGIFRIFRIHTYIQWKFSVLFN